MPWVTLGTALVGGAVLGWWAPREALEWNAALVTREPWRLMTAAWCHIDSTHLLINLAASLVVVVFGRLAHCGLRETWAWLAAWPLTHALLSLQPQLQRYAGLSGVLHAGVAIASLALLTRARGQPRLIGAAVLAGLLVKLLLEDPLTAAVQRVPEWSFPVAVWGHASGVAAGLVCGMAAWVTSRQSGSRTIG